ncbi:MAG: hypothetical protein UIH27_16285 [Ruminococcus sp.]|nr:hypothetical protein [Ruminococcus sp.]
MSEIMYSVKYDDGLCSYRIEKEINDAKISIIVYDTSFGRNVIIRTITYKNIGKEYSSPFLSWYNLIFCSNNYGPAPNYPYMHSAVQDGKKTAATVYIDPNSEKGKVFVEKLPESCGFAPLDNTMIYVYRKGKLSDFFSFEEIRDIYQKHGIIFLNWDIIQKFFDDPLSEFADETKCGFSLQSGGSKEQLVIKGLILGYPIESTIEMFG